MTKKQFLALEWQTNAAFWLFIAVILVQIPHMAEHTIQVNQVFLDVQEPKGVLGAVFDTVAVHVAFNVGVFVLLALAWLRYNSHAPAWKEAPGGRKWFAALLWFQGYHAIEHVLQGIQHWGLGMENPPGLIGAVLPNVMAHFQLNLILTIMVFIVFAKLRPRRAMHAGHTSK